MEKFTDIKEGKLEGQFRNGYSARLKLKWETFRQIGSNHFDSFKKPLN